MHTGKQPHGTVETSALSNRSTRLAILALIRLSLLFYFFFGTFAYSLTFLLKHPVLRNPGTMKPTHVYNLKFVRLKSEFSSGQYLKNLKKIKLTAI